MSVDMKKMIMLPRLTGLKQAIFCKRLALFNETFAPVGGWKKSKTSKPPVVLWHKAKGAFIHFIYKNCDIESCIFCACNCSAQNKNRFLFTALVSEVNQYCNTFDHH